MQEVKFTPRTTVDPLQQANLQNVLTTLETQAPLSPLLNEKSNLTVSSAPLNLDALVAKLNVETADTKETTAKMTLSSAFETVIAKAIESGNVSAKNMEILDAASGMSEQLDEVNAKIPQLEKDVKQLEQDVAKKQNDVNVAQNNVNQLTNDLEQLKQQETRTNKDVQNRQAEVDSLKKQIAAETDPAKRAQLENQLAVAEGQLTKAKKALTDIQGKITGTQQSLTAAQATLATAQNDLASAKTALNNKKTELQTAKEQKAALEQQLKDKMSELTDVDVIRALAEALKMDAADVQNLVQDNKAERSEEQEKYLDKHNPLRIMQDAVANYDQEILDTIASKREDKI